MSDKGESSKGKRIKYSDDDQKETRDETEHKAGEQIPPPSPLIPPGLSAEDLSIFYTAYERDIDGGLQDFMKQQQQALQLQEQIHSSSQKTRYYEHHGRGSGEDWFQEQMDNPFQMLLEPSQLSQRKTDVDPEGYKSDDFETYSTDSDDEKEELDPIEEPIFELKISDANRFVIPYQMASSHFPPLMLHPNSEEILQFTDPLRREWKMTLTYDGDAHAYVITNGWNLYLKHYRLNPPDMIRAFMPVPQLHINHFNIEHQKNVGPLLFELLVPRSNRLPIPCHLAVHYFNPLKALSPPDHLREYALFLTDSLNFTWRMRFICFEEEKAYVVVRGWENYAARYALNHKDTIRFFRRNPILGGNSFIIYHESRPMILESLSPDYINPPLCLRENLLCELDLSKEDVEFGRLEMPGVEIPFEFRNKEMVKLTDENCKDWYVIIVHPSVSREYMILDGWEGIVREHALEAGDMVRFYVPACPDHGKHFLIECAKKKKKKIEKEEGESGSGKHDDGTGLRQGGSRKGKEIAE